MTKQEHFANHLYRKKTITRIKKKINLAGLESFNVYTFLNVRFLLSICLFLLVFLFFKFGYILAPLFTILFFVCSEQCVLDRKIKKRKAKLEEEAIFFFEILGVTLETSQHLKGAIELTAKNINNELAIEFQKTLAEIKIGKSFTESLVAMKERIPSDAINTILLNLTEASIFGNNIQESLKNQLEYLRDKKMMAIKAEINKLPTKISVLSVLFFIPIMLLIILAPVVLSFLLG